MKAELEKNGIDCIFTKAKDGKVHCVYPAEKAEQVAVVKADYKSLTDEIAQTFIARKVDGKNVVADFESGKTIDLSKYGGYMKKYQMVELCMREFGYSKAKAEIAAAKICDDLRLDPSKYLLKQQQLDNVSMVKTNIRYDNDDITLRDYSFSAVNFKNGDNTHMR